VCENWRLYRIRARLQCTCRGSGLPSVGFSRCRPKDQGLKALDPKPLLFGTPNGCPGVSTLSLTAECQLTTALARLREGGRDAVGEGFAVAGRKQPLTPGFAVPSPLGEGGYQLSSPVSSPGESKCTNSSGTPKVYGAMIHNRQFSHSVWDHFLGGRQRPACPGLSGSAGKSPWLASPAQFWCRRVDSSTLTSSLGRRWT